MSRKQRRFGLPVVIMLLVWMLAVSLTAAAAEGDDDNSLAGLGITTEGATVTPEFSYDTWTYSVVVPAGTTELTLSPVTSNANATVETSGTTIGEDGTTTVTIMVTAVNGDQFAYMLNVSTAEGDAAAAAAAEAETEEPETETQPQTEEIQVVIEPETEDPQYVKVDRNSLQEAENTISRLKSELASSQERVSLFRKILYGLIAAAVILLFLLINLMLRKKDLQREVNEYRRLGYSREEAAQMRTAAASAAADEPWEDADEWDNEAPARGSRKKARAAQKEKKLNVPQYENAQGTTAAAVKNSGNARSSWADQQVGTPVAPSSRDVQNMNYAQTAKQNVPQDLAQGQISRRTGGAAGKNASSAAAGSETKLYTEEMQAELRRATAAANPAASQVSQNTKLSGGVKEAAQRAANTAQTAAANAAQSAANAAQTTAAGAAQTTANAAQSAAATAQRAADAADAAAEQAAAAAAAQSTGTRPAHGEARIDMVEL